MVGPLSGVILGGVFLAGPLSEGHYLVFLIPGAMTAVAVRSLMARLLLFGALLTAAYASVYFHGVGVSQVALQARLVLIELLVFGGCAWALVAGLRGDADDGENRPRAGDDIVCRYGNAVHDVMPSKHFRVVGWTR